MDFDPNSLNIIPLLGAWIGQHGVRVVLILVVAAILDGILKAVLKRKLVFPVDQKIKDRFSNRIGPDQKKRISTVVGAIGGTLTFLVYIIAILMVLPELGVNIAPILAGLGLAGLAVGMAAKDVLADFLAGALPQGYTRASVPRAAFSHSASEGSLAPAQRQYAFASIQFTKITG